MEHPAPAMISPPAPYILLLLLLLLVPTATAQPQNTAPPLPQFESLNFNKTVATVLLILFAVFFIVGIFLIFARQCTERRITGRPDLPHPIFAGASGRQQPQGLEAAIIDTFPTFVYSEVKALKLGRVTLECAVCLNEFLEVETLRLIPQCSHVFHASCVDAWLLNHSTCPVCRADLEPASFIAIQISDVVDAEPAGSPEPEVQHGNNDRVDDDGDRNRMLTESSGANIDELNRPVRSWSTGFSRLFPRSHSTGHLPTRPGLDHERFTLRLPEEVRDRLVNSAKLSRTKSWGASATLQRERSGRSGYRTRSERRHVQYERFSQASRSDRWGFMCTPPFMGRAGSMLLTRNANKPAMDEVVVGESSTDRLFFVE